MRIILDQRAILYIPFSDKLLFGHSLRHADVSLDSRQIREESRILHGSCDASDARLMHADC